METSLFERGQTGRLGVFCRCIECEEIISNPICPECLVTQMKAMVAESRPDLAEEIDPMNFAGESTCIQCSKDFSLCAHCFSKDIYFQLKEKDEAIAQEFMRRFDFELRVALM